MKRKKLYKFYKEDQELKLTEDQENESALGRIMIIESSIPVKLGARVQVLQLVYEGSELIQERLVFGHIARPATKEEYLEESHDGARENQYFYYEVRLENEKR